MRIGTTSAQTVLLVCLALLSACRSKAEENAATDPLYCAEYLCEQETGFPFDCYTTVEYLNLEAGRLHDAFRLAAKTSFSSYGAAETLGRMLDAGYDPGPIEEAVEASIEWAHKLEKEDEEVIGSVVYHATAKRLVMMTPLLLRLRREADVDDTLELAERLVERVSPGTHSLTACEVGALMWRHGHVERAERLKERCRQFLDEEAAFGHRAFVFGLSVGPSVGIATWGSTVNAQAWADAGHREWALDFVPPAALALAREDDPEWEGVNAYRYRDLVKVYATLGEFNEAEAWLGRIRVPRQRIAGLAHLARARHERGEDELARAVAAEAESLLPSLAERDPHLKTKFQRLSGRSDLADLLVTLGDREGARRVLLPALGEEAAAGSYWPCGNASLLSRKLAKAGDFPEAMRLAATIDTRYAMVLALATLGSEALKQGYTFGPEELAMLKAISERDDLRDFPKRGE